MFVRFRSALKKVWAELGMYGEALSFSLWDDAYMYSRHLETRIEELERRLASEASSTSHDGNSTVPGGGGEDVQA